MKRFLFTNSNNLYSNDLNWNIYVPVDVFLVMVQIISDQLKKKDKSWIYFDSRLCVEFFECLDTFEQLTAHLRYDSLLIGLQSAHHCVTFARTCLSISKYAYIVALKGMIQHFDAQIFIDLPLGSKLRVRFLPNKIK